MRRTPCPLRDDVRVADEREADAAPHPVGVDEEIVELGRLAVRRRGDEADDAAVLDRDPCAALVHAGGVELEDLGMLEQSRAIAVIGQGSPAEHLADLGDVGRRSVADHDGRTVSVRELVERDAAVEARLLGQAEHALADDVALDLVGAAADRERRRGEEQRVPGLAVRSSASAPRMRSARSV